MTTSETFRKPDGTVFWSLACEDALLAIEFALDQVEDWNEKVQFLDDWRQGDVQAWPDFITYAERDWAWKNKKTSTE